MIVETKDDPLRVLSAEVAPNTTELAVPETFATKGEYKVEVLAIEKSGNQTLTEVPFSAE